MPKADLVITSYCKIKRNAIWWEENKIVSSGSENTSYFFAEAYKALGLNYPKFHKMDSLSKLGFLAAEAVLSKSGFLHRNNLNETAIILSNKASSLDTDRTYQKSINDKTQYLPSPATFVYTLPNIVIGEIAIKHKITGENAFFVSEKMEAVPLVNYAQQLFTENKTSAAICGWVDYDESHYEAFIYLVEKASDSIKSVNFKALNQSILNQLYQH
jgi:3-oxoacyl-(acyl-carrier-protein) synthase